MDYMLRTVYMKHLLLNEHLRNKFGERVQRIPLDPGFGCPNRLDDSLGGCIFCDDSGSAAPWISKGMDIKEQLRLGAEIASRRYGSKKYIAYFQAFTSSFAKPCVLEKIYTEVLSYPGVVGLAVSTRPDCISEDVLDVFERLSKKTYLWIELGAQSMLDKSLEWMNRGHKAEVFKDAVKRSKQRKLEVIGHIIFGLPTESEKEVLESFKLFLDTGIDGYKIHALHIIKGTKLEELYKSSPFKLITMNEYIQLVKKALDMTPSDKVIHRLTGEVSADKLFLPDWVLKKNQILQDLRSEL
jgi:uncharacterized protein